MRRRVLSLSVAAAMTAVLVPATSASAVSETYVVTTTADTFDGTCDADCSLRDAISEANANVGHDTIELPAGTYTTAIDGTDEDLNVDGDYDILDDVTIVGAGSDVTIIDGDGDGDGETDGDERLFDADAGVALGLVGLTVTGGDEDGNGGGVDMDEAGVLSLDDVTFDGNNASSDGGGVRLDDGGIIRIENSLFTGNTAGSDGGGLEYSEGSLTLRNTTFEMNEASSDGGGIAMYIETTALVWDATFDQNVAGTDGGGIGIGLSSYGSHLECYRCVFTDNTAESEGGGLSAYDNQTYVELHDNLFRGNVAEGEGGGLWIDESFLLMENSRVVENQSYEHGGGIGGEDMYIILRDVEIVDNRAFDTDSPTDSTTGGGISNDEDYGTMLLERVLIEGNTATHAGAGLYLYETSVVIRDSVFRDNVVDARGATHDGEGGAIGETNESRLVVRNTLFEGNQVFSDMNAEGGVMRLEEGPASFYDSTFRNNSATTTYDDTLEDWRALGGAFYVEDEATPHVFERSLFVGNSATAPTSGLGHGGAIHAEGDGTAVATNSTFSANDASHSGGAFHGEDGGTLRAQSSTFVGNTSPDGAAVQLAADTGNGAGRARVVGSLFESHGDDTCAGEAIVSNGWNIVDDTTCGLDEPSDQDDTAGATLPLADNGGPTLTHAIPDTSPAVDTGESACAGPADVFELTTDQRGANRPVDGDGDGTAACDVGAFELQEAVTVVATDAEAAEAPEDGDDGTGTFTFSRPGTSGDLVVTWTIGGTATADDDYTALTGEVTIPDGEASATVTVTPIADEDADEGDETVVVTLAPGSGYVIGTPDEATVTIADDTGPEGPVPTPGATRLAGDTRTATAIAVSQDSYGDDEAAAVVLTRSDIFPDALAGTPLAAAVDAPILLTSPTALESDVADEIDRVLPDGATVYLLGGPVALAPAVEVALDAKGYDTQRIAGDDRIATSIAIAGELGDPDTILLTIGTNFPDALAAGAAAAVVGGSVVLTTPGVSNATTNGYLADQAGATVYAVGGPAASAHPSADGIVGANRAETAVLVAEEFFDAPVVVGLAISTNFPDALAGGVHVARLGGPLLLTDGGTLDAVVDDYLCDESASIGSMYAYGGTGVLSSGVFSAAAARTTGSGC